MKIRTLVRPSDKQKAEAGGDEQAALRRMLDQHYVVQLEDGVRIGAIDFALVDEHGGARIRIELEVDQRGFDAAGEEERDCTPHAGHLTRAAAVSAVTRNFRSETGFRGA